jgi:phosphate-selective porin OprO/OprP
MMRRLASRLTIAAVLLVAAPSAAQTPDPAGKKPKEGFRFEFEERPSFRFGDVLRIDVRAKGQGDWRWLSPDVETDEGVFDPTRARLGIEGRLLKYFEFEIEREARDTTYRWRDVYLNVNLLEEAQVKVGKFKIPFSLDQLTGAFNQDFVHRSRIATFLAPARDVGIMVHGTPLGRRLGYEVGIFRQDGENARGERDLDRSGQQTVAARVSSQPLRRFIRGPLREITLGAATTVGDVPEGLNSLRARTVFPNIEANLFDRLYVLGRRVRVGLEGAWEPGPFSIKSEFIHVQDQRIRQSNFDTDLSDAISRGWYLSGTWLVTGDKKEGGVDPRREIFHRAIGAVELAVRYEQIRFASAEHPGEAFSNPRAENILQNSDRVFTAGVNWYVNRWIKMQFNGIRERVEDPARAPILDRTRYWTAVGRLQIVL